MLDHLAQNEGSCNITYNINLSGISILFSNKRHDLSKATDWVVTHYILTKRKSELKATKIKHHFWTD